MGMELEWKYAANKAKLARLKADFSGFFPIAMETTYYDTPDLALGAQRITLRRRYENGKSVCTLKTPGQGNLRGEWDTEAASIEEAIPVLCKLSGWGQLPDLLSAGVIPVCGARFTRLAATLTLPECTLELALDEGVLMGGGREMPLCEVEVEFKSGSQEAAHRFAQDLAGRYDLAPENRSKFARARQLAKGE